jgi:hypothetical protein
MWRSTSVTVASLTSTADRPARDRRPAERRADAVAVLTARQDHHRERALPVERTRNPRDGVVRPIRGEMEERVVDRGP